MAINNYNFSEPIKPLEKKDSEYDVISMGPIKTIPHNWNTWTIIEV